jgi:hypothetical protein
MTTSVSYQFPKITMSRLFYFLFFPALVAMAGCATSANTGKESFHNLLVIGVAGDWNSRAQFERVVVSGLRAEGVDAQSYNLVAGGDKLPTRDDVWSAETRAPKSDNVAALIDESAKLVVRQLRRSGRISR